NPPSSPGGTPSVGVFLDFDSQPAEASVEVMKKEVDDLLRPSGISLDWRSTKTNRGTETYDGVVVLKFRGKCKVESWQQQSAESGDIGGDTALGKTKVVGGKVLPFSEVECDEVRKALSYLGPEANKKQRQTILGLVMARVVAHELYHILARTTEHTAQGLA